MDSTDKKIAGCFVIMILVVVGIWLGTTKAEAQPAITIDGNAYDLGVSSIELVSRKQFNCPTEERYYEANDFDKDGDLDDGCVDRDTGEGLEYDPCVFNSVTEVRVSFEAGGGVCLSKAEYEERQAQLCDGFSPQPTECND
jgi:hypothetical protein